MTRYSDDDYLNSAVSNLDLDSTKFISSLPAPVRRRVTRLKEIQSDQNKIKAEFETAVRELEKKYWARYQPLFRQRYTIVNSDVDPTPNAPKGVPNFWLLALKKHPDIGISISQRDEAALKSLVEIRAEYLSGANFRLFFDFTPNQYFSNQVLTKTYVYKKDSNTGLSTPDHAIGDTIHWKPRKDLTVMIEETKKKDKRTNKTRVVEDTIPVDSFFDFFSPPEALADGDEDIDESDDLLRTTDFDNGEEIKDEIIPRAVDWYTGEAAEEFEDSGDEEDEDGSDEDEEDEEDEEDDGEEEEDEDEDEEEDKDSYGHGYSKYQRGY